MIKTVQILQTEDKVTKAGKGFTRFKTDTDGWMSCFDSADILRLKDSAMKSLPINVKIIETTKEINGENVTFKNIKGVSSDSPEDIPVVKPGVPLAHSVPQETKVLEGIQQRSNSRNATMYVSYAKDLVVAGKTIEEALVIVNRAKEEFE